MKSKRSSERTFGLFFGVVTLLAILFFNFSPLMQAIIGATGVVLIALGLFVPHSLKVWNILWIRFGIVLGGLIAPLVMGVLFYMLITPIGVLSKFFGANNLDIEKDEGADSYWINRQNQPESMKRLY